MNFPYPPTDNLYKFLALAGTLIVILSWYVPSHMIDGIDEKLTAVEVETSRLGVALRFEKIRAEHLKHMMGYSIEVKELAIPAESLLVTYTSDEIKQAQTHLLDVAQSSEEKSHELEVLTKRIGELTDDAKRAYYGSVISMLIGLGTALVGFWFWYWRIQRHEDRWLSERGRGPHQPAPTFE